MFIKIASLSVAQNGCRLPSAVRLGSAHNIPADYLLIIASVQADYAYLFILLSKTLCNIELIKAP